MIKYEDLQWVDKSYIISFISLLVLGLFLISIGNSSTAYFFITLAFAILSVGLGFKAMDIAKKSEELAKESRDRMKSLVNVKFDEVKGAIEDRRLKLRKQRGIIEQKKKKEIDTFEDELNILFIHSFGIWKCYTFLEQALKLKNWLEKADQKQLIDYICMFFDELRYGGIVLSEENLRHIDMMYNSVSQLDRLKGDKDFENKLKTAYESLKSNKK